MSCAIWITVGYSSPPTPSHRSTIVVGVRRTNSISVRPVGLCSPRQCARWQSGPQYATSLHRPQKRAAPGAARLSADVAEAVRRLGAVAMERAAHSVVLITPYDSILAIAKRRFRAMPIEYVLRHRFE